MLPKLRIASREALAFVRQAALLRHDVTSPVLPSELAVGDDVVVCLHGLFATAGVLRPLRRTLEQAGVRTVTTTYAPGPGIDKLADRLAPLMAELGDVRVHLVGHSLGGLVARRFATRAVDPRVVQTISLGSPFAGLRATGHGLTGGLTGLVLTGLASSNFGLPRLGAELVRDLEPQSAVLRELRLATSTVPHLSILAADDQFVSSPMSHTLASGEVELISECAHNTLLFDERVLAIVERRVLAMAGSRRAD